MTLFVTGATGNQGGAVARCLIQRGGKVKALVRDPESARAQNLKKSNVELIQGDLNKVDSMRDHVKGADAIFCVLAFDHGIKKEITQGTNLANLAKECNVKHFVYSSVVGADLHTGIPHWESKFTIENHIRQIGLPFTIIRPAVFYENFLIPQVKSRIVKGRLPSPVNKDKIQQFISTDDIGKIASAILMNPGKHIGNTLTIAAEQMDMQQAAATFSEVLSKEVKYQKLPGLITRLVMGKDLYTMFRWVNENNAVFVDDLDAFRKEYPDMMALKEWIRVNFGNRSGLKPI